MLWWSGALAWMCIATTSSRRSASRAVIVAGGCKRRGRSRRHSRGSTELGEWLAAFGVTLVGMEATGVYWKTVFYALEDEFECWLFNAQHLRQRGVGLALRLLSDGVVEQSSLVGFDLDS